MNRTAFPRQADLRKGRFSQPYALYLITKCSLDHAVWLPFQREDMVQAFFGLRERGELRLHAFVVMPDHWHALFSLGGIRSLSQTIHALCRAGSFNSRQKGMKLSWQEGFHDHKIREDESVVDIVRYIEGNPVRKNLVPAAEDWPWSSANALNRERLDRAFLGPERWRER